MADDHWDEFLKQWSRDLLERLPNDLLSEVDDASRASLWLGYSRATEEAIADANERLGLSFPPTYLSFLRRTDGWRRLDASVSRLLPVEEVDRLVSRSPEVVEGWLEGVEMGPVESIPDEAYFDYGPDQDVASIRPQYLRTALAIGEGDDAHVLLIPDVVSSDGEWEAWFFASWLPGAQRHPSFLELMRSLHQAFVHEFPKLREA